MPVPLLGDVPRRPRPRLRPWIAAASVSVLLGAAAACGAPDTTQSAAPPRVDETSPTLLPRATRPTLPPLVVPSTTTPPPSRVPTTGPRSSQAEGKYAVGLTTLSFTDSTRPTAARGSEPARDTRALVSTIRYPANGTADSPEGKLEPAKSAGPFPMVVFVHGFNTSAARYDQLLHQLAANGYVVVAPDFPLTSSALPGPAVEADVVNQPADVKFMISKLLTENDHPGDLQGMIDKDKIAVAGHSDGGNTAAATAYNSCCIDTRVKAAVMLAAEKKLFPETWFPPPSGAQPAPAFLGMHSDKDEVTPYKNGQELYSGASIPKHFVTIVGGNHQDPFTGGAEAPAASRLIVEFLDGYLRHDAGAIPKLRNDAKQSPFQIESSAP